MKANTLQTFRGSEIINSQENIYLIASIVDINPGRVAGKESIISFAGKDCYSDYILRIWIQVVKNPASSSNCWRKSLKKLSQEKVSHSPEKFDYCSQLDSIISIAVKKAIKVPALKNVRQHRRHSPVVVEPPDVDVPAAFLVLELSEVLRNDDMVYLEDNDIHTYRASSKKTWL